MKPGVAGYLYPANFFEYVWLFFQGQNGRLLQGILCAVVWQFSQWMGFGPEAFPVHLLQGASMFFVITACGLMVSSSGLKKFWVALVGVIFLLLAWNGRVVEYTFFFPNYYQQYALPLLLIALWIHWTATESQHKKKGEWMIFGALVLSLEQALVVTPVLFFLGEFVFSPKFVVSLRNIVKRFVIVLASFLFFSAIFFGSPGQRARMGMVSSQTIDFGVIRTWLSESIVGVFSQLLPSAPHTNVAVFKWFFLLMLLIQSFFLVSYAFQNRRDNLYFARGAVLQVCFLFSMLTKLATPYLPDWAWVLPVFLFLSSFFYFLLGLVVRFQKLKIPVVVGVTLFTLFESSAHVKYSRERVGAFRLLDTERVAQRVQLLNAVQSSGKKNFELKGFSKFPQGWSLDAPWGLDAYLRWKTGRKDLHAWMEQDQYMIEPSLLKDAHVIQRR